MLQKQLRKENNYLFILSNFSLALFSFQCDFFFLEKRKTPPEKEKLR
jgi:hypothetical protein